MYHFPRLIRSMILVLLLTQPTQYFRRSSYPEHVWCKLQNIHKDKLLIRICYQTLTASIYQNDIDTSLCDLLNELSGKHFVLMGDFNYPDIDWNVNQCLPTASRAQPFCNSCNSLCNMLLLKPD